MICLKYLTRVGMALCACSLAVGQHGALRISEPALARDHTIMTSEPAIQLKGTLEWTGGDSRVLWKNQRGFSDLATTKIAQDGHTIEWSTTASIPLRPGVNQVSIRALGQPGTGEFVNVYYSVQTPPLPPRQTAAMFKGRQIAYEEIDGLAVYQSDMILGTPEEAKAGRFRGRLASGGVQIRPQSLTIPPNLNYGSGLWPNVNGVVRVPYTIANTSGDLTNLNAAITESNTQLAGVVQWVPATGSDVNLVSFNLNGAANGSCEAVVGMQGGTQPIGGASNCAVTTILHEMGHALGLYHEQSRADRGTWISYMESNVDKPQHANFDIISAEVDAGLFNYASIMEYSSFLFSRYGVTPVLETVPAGMVLGTDLPQYTTGDIDGIERLYGFFPSKITVDSNPAGLQLTVDNVACTAPCVFSNWTLGSQHTLAVSQTIQTLSGQSYLFGRWNSDTTNSQAATVTVTNAAGNGSLLSPTTSPGVTNYLASFIPLHPYNPQIQSNNEANPSSVGSIAVSPAPFTGNLNGVPNTSYFKDRQYINLNATPKNGYTFYSWDNVSLPAPYASVFNLYLTSNLDSSVTAFFVNDAVTTVTAESSDVGIGISPGFSFGVVENSRIPATSLTAYTPRNFDASQDGIGFEVGSQLTFCGSGQNGTFCPPTPVPQSPVTTNMTYVNYSWSGYSGSSGNAVVLNSIPANGAQFGLNFSYTFRMIVLPSISSAFCPGIQISTNPAGVTANQSTDGGLDAFYAPGLLTFTAAGDPGVVSLTTWSGDLGGAATPYEQTEFIQLVATANYNVSGTTVGFPLAVTNVSPASPTVTGLATNLIVTGSGFTTNGNTYAYLATGSGVNGTVFSPRNITVQSATQLTMQLQAGDLSSIGYAQIEILNTGGSGCNPQTFFTFPVADPSGAPALSISKMHNGVFGPGEQNAQYTVLMTNSGSATTTAPVTVTENPPLGETLVSMAGQNGSGWTCSTQTTPYTCTNSSPLNPSASFGLITVTVNVAGDATSPQVNSVTVSGGGAPSATATDSTLIESSVTVPNVVGEAMNMAESTLTGAGLTIGNVTYATSGTVPSGDVISTNPIGGTQETPGAVVSIVVSVGATATLQSITVTPTNPTIIKGQTLQFAATGHYNDGTTPNITGSVTWSSSHTNVATISGTGKATSVATGSTTIAASMGTSPTISGSTTLTVTGLSACDVNGDGMYSVVDVQTLINEALGKNPPANDLNGDGVVNVVDIELVVNALLFSVCTL